MQRDGITACAWKDKKMVYFLTSGCHSSGDDTVQRRKKNGTLENISAPPTVWIMPTRREMTTASL